MNAVTAVSAGTVFVQGILSFFSPCVVPLLPVYMGYLAGGAAQEDENGAVRWPKKRMLVNTLFFVLGVSFVFFALGAGITALGGVFSGSRIWIARLSGAMIILLGLWQLGVFRRPAAMDRERRIPLDPSKLAMNPLSALLLGFTFSFAWTPCVGPALSSVLLMAASSDSAARGYLLIGLYTLGFVLPFLVLGFFTGEALNFFRAHRKAMRNTVKAGAVLLIAMGVLTAAGLTNTAAGLLARSSGGAAAAPAASSSPSVTDTAAAVSAPPVQSADVSAPAASSAAASGQSAAPAAAVQAPADAQTPQPAQTPAAAQTPQPAQTPAQTPQPAESTASPAPDFTLTDQYGVAHTLSACKGKVVFLNFWATWCGPCRSELGDIQALYNAHGSNSGDVVVLGAAAPGWSGEGTADEVAAFLSAGGYTYPVVMDAGAGAFRSYGVTAFPTTYIIGRDGAVFARSVGAMSGAKMESLVQQALSAG